MAQFPHFGLPEEIIRSQLPGFGIPTSIDMGLPSDVATGGDFASRAMSSGRAAPSFEEVDAAAIKKSDNILSAMKADVPVDKSVAGPLEGIRKAIRARDEKGMKREHDKLAHALGDPDSFASIASDFLFNRSVGSLSARRAAGKIIEAVIMEEDALARQPRLTVGDVLGSQLIAKAMVPYLRPEQFKTTPFGQPVDSRALAFVPGGGSAPMIDPNLPPDIRPQDLVSYAPGTNKPVARGLVMVAPNPSAALDPSQTARFAAMVPEEAKAAFKPSGAMPSELQQGILYADMMAKTFPELATRENVMAWVDKGAKLVKQPEMTGSFGARRAAAEATIEEARARDINLELSLGRDKLKEQIKGEANKNLYDAQTWSDRVKLTQAQLANIESEIRAREAGEVHWKRMYELQDEKLKLALQAAALAIEKKDKELFDSSKEWVKMGFESLVTALKEKPALWTNENFQKLWNGYSRLLPIPYELAVEKGLNFFKELAVRPSTPALPPPLPSPGIDTPEKARKRYEESREKLKPVLKELDDMLEKLKER